MQSTDRTLSLPNHVGIILDGNRRWAKAKGLPMLEGHRQGSEVFKTISFACFERGVKYLSAYVFSTENWTRTEEEVSYLMQLLLKAVEKYLVEFNNKGIKIVILGSREGLSPKVLRGIKQAEAKTASNTKGTLALCLNYGGKQEITDAVKQIVGNVTDTDDITEDAITQALYEPSIPDIDLLIRTSGEQRTSGFMLWRTAYAELYFSDKFWPDFTVADLDIALEEFAARQRRFGQ